MDFSQAMGWLEDNKDIAKKWFYKYGSLTPYDAEDFHSVVTESVLVAALALGERPSTEFEGIFVKTLQTRMATVIPGYGACEKNTRGNVSMSIHSNCCESYEGGFECGEFSTDSNLYDRFYNTDFEEEFANPAFNAEHAYYLIQDHIDDRQKTVLIHSLGLTDKGQMSVREIEKETGISKSTANRQLEKITIQVSSLVGKGVIKPYSPLPPRSSLDFEPRFGASL